MKTKTITTYSLTELTGRAQENAFDLLREWQFDNDWYETVIDDAATIANLFGLDMDTRPVKLMNGKTRQTTSVYFDLDRGSYLSFEGNYSYKKGALAAVKDYAPIDTELHRIVKGLQEVQRTNFYQLHASCSHGRECLRVSTARYDSVDISDDTEETVKELLTDFAWWIHSCLQEESDYLSSEEALLERAEANDYQFDEFGHLA